ncbi:MAG: replicative DNA helicase [Nitrospirae bacterium]|nr:replicative DNA helicase [Nitrospirota bacterium]
MAQTQTESLIHKLPPQHLEAEQAILGAILLENDALHTALEILSVDDLYRESHRKIFRAMLELSEAREAIDLITLTEHLRKQGTLEEVGDRSYLALLVNSVPTAANTRHHAKIVHEKALLRRLIEATTEILTESYDDQREVDDLLDVAEQRIFQISEGKVRPGFVPIKEIVKGSFEMIERLYEKQERITGVPTGYRDLDDLTSGLHPGDLIVVAGRPSMGKTALCLNVAEHVGIEKREPVAIFSLEMAKEQLGVRMLCSQARVDSHKLRSGFLGESDWPKLTTAAGRLSEAPIFIDDSPAISIHEMRAKARRLQREHGLGLLIVDYLQLMRGRGAAENRQQEISEISRSLKALAKELRVPVVALSQLSRAVETRGGKKEPILADLRESGAIEQDADVIIFIYREEVYNKTPENRGKAELLVRKQRNGPTGDVTLSFLERYTRFENFESRSEEGY